MNKLQRKYGPGQFTCGARYICFLPEGGIAGDYIHLAVRPPEMSEEDWAIFSDTVVDLLMDA